MAENANDGDGSVSIQLEHHVLDRPLIRRTRRRPSSIAFNAADAENAGNNNKPIETQQAMSAGMKAEEKPHVSRGADENSRPKRVPPPLPWKDPSLRSKDPEALAMSNRKWAQILGCPLDEAELKPAKEAAIRLAKQRGAKVTDLDFILEFIKTVPSIEQMQLENQRPLDSTQKKLLQGRSAKRTPSKSRSWRFSNNNAIALN